MADPPATPPAAPPAKEARKPWLGMLNPLLTAFGVTRHEHSTASGALVFEPGQAVEVPPDDIAAVTAHRVTLADPPAPAVVAFVPPDPAAN